MTSSSAAVLIDLDGVVYHAGPDGKYVLIPGAKASLEKLQSHNIPHVFLTNGSGVPESVKCAGLNSLLDKPTYTAQDIIMAQTPLRELAKDNLQSSKPILVVAESSAVSYQLASSLGFQSAISIEDYAALHKPLVPYMKQIGENSTSHAIGGPFDSTTCISAVVILNPPSDWATALQLLCDIAKSVTGLPEEEEASAESLQTIPFHVANPDFEYATQYKHPRFTVGAFITSLKACFYESTSRSLTATAYGKPNAPVYKYALRRLNERTDDVINKVFAIGDNPASDIAGAHRMKENCSEEWESILVTTGIYCKDDVPSVTPSIVCFDLEAAVDLILKT